MQKSAEALAGVKGVFDGLLAGKLNAFPIIFVMRNGWDSIFIITARIGEKGLGDKWKSVVGTDIFAWH